MPRRRDALWACTQQGPGTKGCRVRTPFSPDDHKCNVMMTTDVMQSPALSAFIALFQATQASAFPALYGKSPPPHCGAGLRPCRRRRYPLGCAGLLCSKGNQISRPLNPPLVVLGYHGAKGIQLPAPGLASFSEPFSFGFLPLLGPEVTFIADFLDLASLYHWGAVLMGACPRGVSKPP